MSPAKSLFFWVGSLLCLASLISGQPRTIYVPDKARYYKPGVSYPRAVRLANGDLLSTWEDTSKAPRTLPIFKSTNGGESWAQLSRVSDQNNVGGLRFQPFLYQLRGRIGNLAAGTILLAVNASPDDQAETSIDLYVSNEGVQWKYYSTIAKGGEAIPVNGHPAVWEPFLLEHEGELLCYYSDQRSPLHGQRLVVSRSTNAVSWSTPIDVVAQANREARPGMATVAYIPSTRQYILTYELFDPSLHALHFEVYYRLSDDPLDFIRSEGIALVAPGPITPRSSPYVITRKSNIFVSCGTLTQVFVNRIGGAPNAWRAIETNAPISYSRALVHVPRNILIFAAASEGEGREGADAWQKMTVSDFPIAGRLHLD